MLSDSNVSLDYYLPKRKADAYSNKELADYIAQDIHIFTVLIGDQHTALNITIHKFSVIFQSKLRISDSTRMLPYRKKIPTITCIDIMTYRL